MWFLLAQGTTVFPDKGLGVLGLAVGTALCVFSGARGIGHIAGNAMEAIARQPEAGGRIGTNMIIGCALIEGFTFFALVVCILLALKFQSL
jgi:F-type H+-transporting ATPase subunit c